MLRLHRTFERVHFDVGSWGREGRRACCLDQRAGARNLCPCCTLCLLAIVERPAPILIRPAASGAPAPRCPRFSGFGLPLDLPCLLTLTSPGSPARPEECPARNSCCLSMVTILPFRGMWDLSLCSMAGPIGVVEAYSGLPQRCSWRMTSAVV